MVVTLISVIFHIITIWLSSIPLYLLNYIFIKNSYQSNHVTYYYWSADWWHIQKVDWSKMVPFSSGQQNQLLHAIFTNWCFNIFITFCFKLQRFASKYTLIVFGLIWDFLVLSPSFTCVCFDGAYFSRCNYEIWFWTLGLPNWVLSNYPRLSVSLLVSSSLILS